MRRVDAGVVDHDVEPAERRRRPVREGQGGGGIAEVGGEGRVAPASQGREGLVRRALVGLVVHRHARAMRGEQLGHGAPDAARAAGDQGGAAGEIDGGGHAYFLSCGKPLNSGIRTGSAAIFCSSTSTAFSSCASRPAASSCGRFSSSMVGSTPWFSTASWPSRS